MLQASATINNNYFDVNLASTAPLEIHKKLVKLANLHEDINIVSPQTYYQGFYARRGLHTAQEIKNELNQILSFYGNGNFKIKLNTRS